MRNLRPTAFTFVMVLAFLLFDAALTAMGLHGNATHGLIAWVAFVTARNIEWLARQPRTIVPTPRQPHTPVAPLPRPPKKK